MKPDNGNPEPQNPTRRSTLRTLLMGGGAVTLSTLPAQWTRPVVDTVLLPAHAQTSETPARNGFTVPTQVTGIPNRQGWLAGLLNRVVPTAHASAPFVPAGALCIESTDTGWRASYNAAGDILVGSGNYGECKVLQCLGSVPLRVTQKNADGSFDFELYGVGSNCLATTPLVAGTTDEACSLETCLD